MMMSALAWWFMLALLDGTYSFHLSSPSTIIRTRPSFTTTKSTIELRESNEKDVIFTEDMIDRSSRNTDEWLRKDLEMHLQDVQPDIMQPKIRTPVKIIFSDIDGSLIHYPKQPPSEDDQDNRIISLPPSATGMQGVISSKTLLLCRDLRDKKGVKLVLVTGARTSTLLNRLPYLPKADAYCTESGGRIFYPTNVDCCHGEEGSQFTYTPVEYSGSDIEIDLHPFGLREDMTWRKRMEVGGAGTEAYNGNEVLSNRCDGVSEDDECLLELYESIQGFPIVEDEVPINQRPGHLWDFANQLVKMEGFVLDTKSYSTCFRVNKKHQTNGKFDALLNGEIAHPEMTIGKSTNLGCIDFFPAISGKQNWYVKLSVVIYLIQIYIARLT